ncbi:hypothetical protein [uncultured Tessaracoccus sp.]|uniref:hypothetical protein n=1 Tax=uncultured Tessaracoccus sp. TaxID=905023 RepID=UPI00263346B6|nr:hypothetical protein [uncultured Tessaracoccus sp.]
MTSAETVMCANGPHPAVGPLHDVTPEGAEPRLICHGCWTLGGLLDDQQRKTAALDVFSGLVKTKREGRGKPQRPRRMWKP